MPRDAQLSLHTDKPHAEMNPGHREDDPAPQPLGGTVIPREAGIT